MNGEPEISVVSSEVVKEGWRSNLLNNKRKVFFLVGFILLLLAASITGYLMLNRHNVPDGSLADTQRRLDELKKESVPSFEAGKVSQYQLLGDAYMETFEYDKAIEQYLLADKAITDRSPATGKAVNMALGYAYEAKGDKNKAREYYQKEITRIKSDSAYAAENQDFINSVEKRIKAL